MRGVEVILQILRLGGHFSGDHDASAPPPSSDRGCNSNMAQYKYKWEFFNFRIYPWENLVNYFPRYFHQKIF